jgi:hypothetical protein
LTKPEEEALGWSKDEISVYSIRKGWMTHTAGTPDGPGFSATSLRAGHSMGVDDRYMFQTVPQDCFCGRVAAGKNVQSTTFGDLPPRFKSGFASSCDWSKYLNCYPRLPQSFKAVVPFLIATLITRWEWLNMHVGAEHPILNNPRVRAMVDEWAPHIISDGILTCSETGMKASGVPLNVILLVRQREVESRLSQITATAELNKKELLDKLPGMLSTEILAKFQVNGALPVTNADLTRVTNSINDRLEELIQQIHRGPNSLQINNAAAINPEPSVSLPEIQPSDYSFPHVLTARLAMMLWWFPSPPNALYGPNPLKPFKNWDRDLLSSKMTKNNYSKMKGICGFISKLSGDSENITQDQFDDKFRSGFIEFKRLAGCKRDRTDETSIMTLYDSLKKAETKLATELQAAAAANLN